jgi:hypothetical protein
MCASFPAFRSVSGDPLPLRGPVHRRAARMLPKCRGHGREAALSRRRRPTTGGERMREPSHEATAADISSLISASSRSPLPLPKAGVVYEPRPATAHHGYASPSTQTSATGA